MKMRALILAGGVGLVAAICGCSPPSPANSVANNTQTQSSGERTRDSSEQGSAVAEDSAIPTTPPTQADLTAQLSRFQVQPPWTYGERTAGELAGSWVSDDAEGDLVEFDLDGKSGTFSEDLGGKRTIGLYAISADGVIVTISRSGDVSLSSHFRLNGDQLSGPRGPNPNVTWRREP
ncbi:MAG: hypothetical protein R3B96_13205 [Pirellulaceae bacterium]